MNDARASITEWTVAETAAALDAPDPPLLVDVREDREFAASRIPGAIHIGRGVLERDAESKLPAGRTIVLYCGGGFRSALAAESLARMGLPGAISMDGGFRGWREAGLRIDADPVELDAG